MTIDEAIAHERKSAKSNREAEALFLRDDFIYNAKEERKYAEEHEQLVGWLEELKQYRAIGTVEEFKVLKENQSKCEDCAGCTNWKCDCANIRTMAIDEFADKIIIMMPGHKQDVLSIAEKLKAGAK